MSKKKPDPPSNPDGYKQFEKPVYKLTDDELKKMIDGKKPDDWWKHDEYGNKVY